MSNNIIVGRTRARSQAIQVLFQAEIQGVDVFDLLQKGEYALDDGPLDKYADILARGVAVNRLAIDRLLANVSHNWNLSRMPLVDRCVMSVAVYEMFCVERVPTSVAISEAVELSKVYGTDDSSSFVNGVLGRVARLAEANPEMPLARVAQIAGSDDADTAQQAPAVVDDDCTVAGDADQDPCEMSADETAVPEQSQEGAQDAVE